MPVKQEPHDNPDANACRHVCPDSERAATEAGQQRPDMPTGVGLLCASDIDLLAEGAVALAQEWAGVCVDQRSPVKREIDYQVAV